MIKVFVLLFFGLTCEAVGFALIGRGLRSIGDLTPLSFKRIFGVVKCAAGNPWLWLGMVFQTTFFAVLLVLIAQRDISFVLPLTTMGMIFTTLAARLLLHERVTALRWTGVILIAFGACLVTLSEQRKTEETHHARTGDAKAGLVVEAVNIQHRRTVACVPTVRRALYVECVPIVNSQPNLSGNSLRP